MAGGDGRTVVPIVKNALVKAITIKTSSLFGGVSYGLIAKTECKLLETRLLGQPNDFLDILRRHRRIRE
jgi:hypothetical protein